MVARILDKYRQQVKPAMVERFGYENPMAIPKLEKLGMGLSAAISVDVPSGDLMKRLTGRRTCKGCGQMYNIHFRAPAKDGTCDKCSGELYQRDDDKEETIKKRLEVYEAQTAPLSDYYGNKGILKSVAGTGDIDEIFEKMCAAIG